ncbi:MAG: hypothetical protein U9O98_08795, partial [Asgard group archaeon]|nr:hypothetical protein [Asgard group archaeon]
MLLEESAKIAHKKFQSENNDEQKNKESKKISKDIEDKQFSATELLEGFIAFGGITYTCKSSLELSGMEKEDLIKGIEIETLHNAVLLMEECDKILCF